MEKAKRFRVSLVLYAVLAVLIWFTAGDGYIKTEYFQASFRALGEAILGAWVVMTVLHWNAEKWRDRLKHGEE
jgi:heme A synthase